MFSGFQVWGGGLWDDCGRIAWTEYPISSSRKLFIIFTHAHPVQCTALHSCLTVLGKQTFRVTVRWEEAAVMSVMSASGPANSVLTSLSPPTGGLHADQVQLTHLHRRSPGLHHHQEQRCRPTTLQWHHSEGTALDHTMCLLQGCSTRGYNGLKEWFPC